MLALLATTRNTAVPTIIHGGHRINVIPSEIFVDVDGRILPGQKPEDFAAAVRALVGDDVDVELTRGGSGLEADPASPLFQTIGAVMHDLDPGCEVVPYLVSGGTDAKSLPGIKVYGFMPSREHPEEATLAHSHDERVSISNLPSAPTRSTRLRHGSVPGKPGQCDLHPFALSAWCGIITRMAETTVVPHTVEVETWNG